MRASSRLRCAFIGRRRNHISGSGAWCCRRDGPVTRLRHRIGIGRIENGRRQRRGKRHIPRLRMCIFDEEPGSKHDCASAQPNRFKSALRHLRSPLRALFRWHQLITSSQHCLSRNRGAEARSHPVSALAQEAAELARATCRRFQAASFDSTRKRRRAIRRYNKDRR